jgi:hypothetical protein
MGTYEVQMKEVLPWLVCCAHCAGTRDFYPALATLVSPVQHIFFLIAHFFNLCVPICYQPGQAVVAGRLSLLCVSGHRLQRRINNRRLKTEQWQVFLERPHAGVDFNTTSKLTLTPVRGQRIWALYFLKVLLTIFTFFIICNIRYI